MHFVERIITITCAKNCKECV